MTDETKVRVRLDTTQATAAMRSLTQQGAKTAGRVSSQVRASVTRGLGVVGLGTAIGAGVAATRGATSSGVGDVMSEAVGGFGSRLAEALLGDLPQEARAARAAREETIQAFGAVAGATGEIPAGARQWFESVKSLRMEEETGRAMFDRFDDFRGKGLDEMIKRIMDGLADLLQKAVDSLAERLNKFLFG